MKARVQLERLFGGPAPAPVAPPKPDVKPGERPAERPGTPGPSRPDPWRRKKIGPGQEPRPKSRHDDRVYAEAVEFLKANDLNDFVS